jgi:hypothetical protein
MQPGDRVILVHGLWMYPFVMALLQHRIERCGYAVESWSYPTVRATLKDNARSLADHCRQYKTGAIHLVGHSMGGLIALTAAALSIPSVRRVVTVGSPLTDSISARRLEKLPGGRMMLGECIGEWLRGPRTEIGGGYEVGVIAGNGGIGLGRVIASDLPQPNDGVVAVCETELPGISDHVVLNVSHTEMLASASVAHHVCAFLKNGHFDRSEGAPT